MPFFVVAEDTTAQEIYLDEIEGVGNTGWVLGSIDPAVNNFLVLAESQTSGEKYSTTSGPDGVFVVFNLPYDSYTVDALKFGHQTRWSIQSMQPCRRQLRWTRCASA